MTVLERESSPDEPVAREGVPQTSHPHVLLEAGRATLEDVFTGVGERLLSAGGLIVDAFSDVKWYDQGDFLAEGSERSPLYSASRALFEYVVREAVTDLGNVRLRERCGLTGFTTTDDARRVTGVRIRDERGAETSVAADLVVDATGRTSKTPAWLDRHGYERPPVEEVNVDVTYSTVRVERPPGDRRTFFVPPSAPRTRGGVSAPIEGDQWEVLLQGVHGDDTPTDPDRVVAFAESLPDEGLGRLLRTRRWTSDVHHYPFPCSRRHHYWDLDRFPSGVVVTGDAVASFNPVYGQGMSVTALEALVLHHALAECDDLEALPRRFFDRVRPVVDDVWQLAVGADFAFSETTGPKPLGTDLFNRYFDRLVRQAHTDPQLRMALGRVLLLEEPPTALLRPGVVWRGLRPDSPLSSLAAAANG